MNKIIWLLCSMAAAGLAEPERTLTLDQALALARKNSPELRSARLKILAAEKAVGASGRWKNPNLRFEAEGVGGDLNGFSDTEYTLELMQTFERGGKRRHDRAVAQESVGIAVHQEAGQELALLSEVREAFIEVMAQQETGKVRAEQEQLGRAFVEVAKARYNAGGSSQIDLVQAELQLEEILLSQTCCFGDLAAARTRLASLIGITENELGELTGDYYTLENIEATDVAASHPSLERIDAQRDALRAMARQAGAGDVADIALGAGFKYEAAADVNTFVLGARMPLNFVRSGRVEEAAILLQADALAADREETLRRLQRELSILISLYTGAKMEAEMTRDRLMPKAREAYELSRAGYDTGRYSWVELIASQQHLAEIRVREIEALKTAHLARAEIQRYLRKEI